MSLLFDTDLNNESLTRITNKALEQLNCVLGHRKESNDINSGDDNNASDDSSSGSEKGTTKNREERKKKCEERRKKKEEERRLKNGEEENNEQKTECQVGTFHCTQSTEDKN